MTEYVKIDPAQATATDEFMLNGRWHRAESVHHLSGARIVVIWPQGGRMAGPVHHLAGRVRRAVEATHSPDCGCLACTTASGMFPPVTCGAGYGDTAVTCALDAGHGGDHEAPTGDDDGVWAWAR